MKWIDPIPFARDTIALARPLPLLGRWRRPKGGLYRVATVHGGYLVQRRATRTRDTLLTCRTQAHSHFLRLYPRPDGAARRISQQITVFKIEDNKVNEEEFEQGLRKISNANSKRDVRISLEERCSA